MPFQHDDGGRAAAGFKGRAGDCVARAISIASGRPYAEVYAILAKGNGEQRASRRTKKRSASARNGVYVRRKWFKDYMRSIGFTWVPTMKIGEGCKVHLVAGELPMGRLVVQVSGHYTSVIDGVVRDTWDPQRRISGVGRDGYVTDVRERCVYGYWIYRRGDAGAISSDPATSRG